MICIIHAGRGVDSRFAAISPQTPSVKRKVSTPATVTPIPKSRLSDISNITPTVSSPLAGKLAAYIPLKATLIIVKHPSRNDDNQVPCYKR